MKKILIIILQLFFLNSFAQQKTTDYLTQMDIQKEVKWFIDTINARQKMYSSYSNQFVEYVVYIHKSDNKNGICITLGCIMNSNDYRDILPQYFFNLDSELVLVRFEKNLKPDSLIGVNLQKLDRENSVKIVQKLYPSSLGGYTYHPPGMITCWEGEMIERKYFDNADEIPFEKSIWKFFPSGGQIEMIQKGK